MFSKLYHKKAVGFKLLGDSIKYALITLNNNKIVVNETQILNLDCKTALHRLQHLLAKYPSASVISSPGSLLKNGPEEIKRAGDRKQIVKNKVESLIENKKVCLNAQSHIKKRSAPFLIAHQEAINERERLLQKNGLKFQKLFLSCQALLSLEQFFFSSSHSKKALFYFAEEKVEVLFLDQKKLTYKGSVQIKELSLEAIEKKILRLFYSHFKSFAEVEVAFHGRVSGLEKMAQNFQKETQSKLQEKNYGHLEEEASDYLEEIGAALSLLKEESGGFQKESLASLFKLYKKPLFANVALAAALFTLSYFYWAQKRSYIQEQNKLLFEKCYSLLNINQETKAAYSSEKVSELNAQLKKKQKESPLYLFQHDTFSVTDTLAWLSDISEKLKDNSCEAPFKIESFKYQLLSRPTAKKTTAPYRVKVSFTFSTDSSLTARKVHEKIESSKAVVDKGKKIDWSYQNNLYRVSFYLKNNIMKKVSDV